MMLDASDIFQASILIVDDKASNVLLLETMLRNLGYLHVTTTMLPRTVCALHAEKRFDLILLDLQMPEMDGFEVMQALKLQDPESYLPVLVITAQPDHKLRALQAGAKDFVSKPFDLVEMQTRIHNMLEVRLLYRKLDDYNKELEQTVLERTAQLRASEARFKSFTELSSDWYWEQDAEGKFTAISGPVLEMLGLNPATGGILSDADTGSDETLESANATLTRAGDAAHDMADAVQRRGEAGDEGEGMTEREQLRANIAARKPFLDLVYSRKQADGRIQYLQVSGEPMFDATSRFIGYRGIGMLLDDRRRPDQLQLCFRGAMGLLEQGVLMLDQTSLQVLDANDTLCRMTGYARAELLAQDCSGLNLGDSANLGAAFARLQEGQALPAQIVNLRGKHGRCLAVSLVWHTLQVNQQWIAVGIISALPELASAVQALAVPQSPLPDACAEQRHA